MTLRSRVLVLLSAFVVLLSLNAFVAGRALETRDAARAWMDRIEDARDSTGQLFTAVVEQQSALRAYVTTGSDGYLEDYESANATAARRIGELSVLLDGHPPLLETANRVDDAHQRWRTSVVTGEIELVRRGDVEAARERLAGGPGQALYGQMRQHVATLQERIDDERAATEQRLTRARTTLSAVLYLTIVLGLVLLASVALVLHLWVIVPLRRLSAAVRTVAGGDHRRRIEIEGPPELAGLGGDAELMRREIVTRLEEAERARQALQQQGPTVLSLRSHLMPSEAPLPPSLSIGVRSQPARGMVAGDWYDLFSLDDRTVAVCLVDVAGHGPGAGVLALRAKQLFVAALQDGKAPGEALQWLARHLGDTGELFLTAVVLLVDVRSGHCRYANAGHPPALIIGGGRREELPPTGPLLGPLESFWETREFQLDLDEMVVACTDGVLEARNERGEEFGMDGLLHTAGAYLVGGPQEVAAQCLDAARSFANEHLTDDLTIVALAIGPRRTRLADAHLDAGYEVESEARPLG